VTLPVRLLGLPFSVLFCLCVSSLLFHHLSLSRETGGFFFANVESRDSESKDSESKG